MKEISIRTYIYLGALHWHLVKLNPALVYKARGENGILESLLILKERIDEAGLSVTLRAGWKLWKIAEEIEADKELDDLPSDMRLRITEAACDLENTLVAEAEGKAAYLITEKRLDKEKLVRKQSALLANGVWKSLPHICTSDFTSACKAIVFELPTAAAFHILRCTEGGLRHYYTGVIKRNRLNPSKRMWGALVLQMRDKKTNKPPVELLDTLDRIRINFRNPTNHPDKIYDIEEAQDLFGLCVDAINRMVKAKNWYLPEDSIRGIRKKYLENSENKDGDAT